MMTTMKTSTSTTLTMLLPRGLGGRPFIGAQPGGGHKGKRVSLGFVYMKKPARWSKPSQSVQYKPRPPATLCLYLLPNMWSAEKKGGGALDGLHLHSAFTEPAQYPEALSKGLSFTHSHSNEWLLPCKVLPCVVASN